MLASTLIKLAASPKISMYKKEEGMKKNKGEGGWGLHEVVGGFANVHNLFTDIQLRISKMGFMGCNL